MRGVALMVSLAGLSACVSLRHAREDRPAGPAMIAPRLAATLPAASGSLMLTGIDLPDAGSNIGGHYIGLRFDERQFIYQLSDAVRDRWADDARQRGEAMLLANGLSVQPLGPATSDARQIRGVQYGLSGHVTQLVLRTTGQSEPYHVDAQVEVAWELLDLGSGSAVFGRTLHGTMHETGTVDSIVGLALDQSLLHLVGDSAFRYALATTRADPDAGSTQLFARALPTDGSVIQLDSSDLNPHNDTVLATRVAAGVVTLRTPENVTGTAFLLTRDGLALTSARAVRDLRRLRARLPNGIERSVRVIRRRRSLDVALIQIGCNNDCETVDWEAPRGVDVFTRIMAVAPPANDLDSASVALGRVGGQWGLANGVTLEVPDGSVTGGEPVAGISSGRVFAMVSSRPGRPVAVLLSEALASLRVHRS